MHRPRAYYYDEYIEPAFHAMYAANEDGNFEDFRDQLTELLWSRYSEYYDTIIETGGDVVSTLLTLLLDAWTQHIWSELDVVEGPLPPADQMERGLYLTDEGLLALCISTTTVTWAPLHSTGALWPFHKVSTVPLPDAQWWAHIPDHYAIQMMLDIYNAAVPEW